MGIEPLVAAINQAHDGSRRHLPEPTNDGAKKGPPGHQDDEVGTQRDDSPEDQRRDGETKQDFPASLPGSRSRSTDSSERREAGSRSPIALPSLMRRSEPLCLSATPGRPH